jgi:hypothetical protein
MAPVSWRGDGDRVGCQVVSARLVGRRRTSLVRLPPTPGDLLEFGDSPRRATVRMQRCR